MTRECIVGSEPVLRLLASMVLSVMYIYPLIIAIVYHVRRRDRIKKLLFVFETSARRVNLRIFVCASYFSLLIFIPFYLVVFKY